MLKNQTVTEASKLAHTAVMQQYLHASKPCRIKDLKSFPEESYTASYTEKRAA